MSPDVSVLLSLVEQFGMPVFPVKPGAKIPLTRSGFKEASRDPLRIRDWAAQFPGCNWAMPTGRASGFNVLDVDVKDGKQGDASLRQFEAEHGPLPKTAMVLTPTGGWHYWFQAGALIIPSSADKIGIGLDIRGEGGYVVIPPSAINGHQYAFEASSDPADVGFALMPAALIEAATAKAKRQAEEEHGDEQPGADPVRNIREGIALHDSLRDLAARSAALGMGFSEIVGLLEGLMHGSKAARDERWRERFQDIHKLVNSAIEKFRKAGAGPTRDLLSSAFWIGEAKATLNLPYVVKGLFGRGQLVVWWGSPGSGKSFLAIDMAAAIGAGLEWRGRRTKRGIVVYVAAESSQMYIANRLAALKQERPEIKAAKVIIVPVAVDLLHAQRGDVEAVIAVCRKITTDHGEEIAEVTIDTLAVTFGGGKENLPEDMGAYLTNVRRIMTETGAAVLIIHHAGKDEARGMRGHSALLGAIDAELAVETTEQNERILRTGKVREGEGYADLFSFSLRPVELGRDADGDAVLTCVVDNGDANSLKKARTKARTGKVQRAVLTLIERRGSIARPELVALLVDQYEFSKSGIQHCIGDLIANGSIRSINGLLTLA